MASLRTTEKLLEKIVTYEVALADVEFPDYSKAAPYLKRC